MASERVSEQMFFLLRFWAMPHHTIHTTVTNLSSMLYHFVHHRKWAHRNETLVVSKWCCVQPFTFAAAAAAASDWTVESKFILNQWMKKPTIYEWIRVYNGSWILAIAVFFFIPLYSISILLPSSWSLSHAPGQTRSFQKQRREKKINRHPLNTEWMGAHFLYWSLVYRRQHFHLLIFPIYLFEHVVFVVVAIATTAATAALWNLISSFMPFVFRYIFFHTRHHHCCVLEWAVKWNYSLPISISMNGIFICFGLLLTIPQKNLSRIG